MGANICLKIAFVGVQVAFIVFGIVLIAMGVWLELQDQRFRELVDRQEFRYGPYMIIAAGCAIILVSGIGMVGALCETKINKFLLGFYIMLVFIILLAELTGGILAFVYRDQATELTRSVLNDTLVLYNLNTTNGTAATKAWDTVQRRLECCGIDGVQDWIGSRVPGLPLNTYPRSCCPNMTNPVCGGITGINTQSYTKGCQEVIVETVSDNLLAIAAVGISFLVGEVAVILMAFCLLCFSDFDD